MAAKEKKQKVYSFEYGKIINNKPSDVPPNEPLTVKTTKEEESITTGKFLSTFSPVKRKVGDYDTTLETSVVKKKRFLTPPEDPLITTYLFNEGNFLLFFGIFLLYR